MKEKGLVMNQEELVMNGGGVSDERRGGEISDEWMVRNEWWMKGNCRLINEDE